MDVARFTELIKGGLENLIAAEQDITRYDELVGDGDCGVGLRRGAEGKISILKTI